uniref:Uncharacterized protein n=1 Tax=Oryza sativa subsp. japonica TaxID=39947 RepID=Q2QX23_ORYSJ|nr:hypothetical protein LOC_Os12g07430 [Oryza sativa Japonica Group]
MGEGVAIATAARDEEGSRCPASVARSPAAAEEDGDRGREVAIAIAAVAAVARGQVVEDIRPILMGLIEFYLF